MSILMIGQREEAEIKNIIAAARAKPKPWVLTKALVQDDPTAVLMLGDRKAGVDEFLKEYPSHQIMLGTYRVAFSIEEQPAGMFRHLSMSSARAGVVPGPQALQMACEAFGFSSALCAIVGSDDVHIRSEQLPSRVWLEEFEPKRFAVNVIELDAP